MSNCFVAGIVKGLVEADDGTRHFGSLLAYRSHLEKAMACGVVAGDYDDPVITGAGRAWYAEKRMNELPQGRSYMWSLVRNDDWTLPSNAI